MQRTTFPLPVHPDLITALLAHGNEMQQAF